MENIAQNVLLRSLIQPALQRETFYRPNMEYTSDKETYTETLLKQQRFSRNWKFIQIRCGLFI